MNEPDHLPEGPDAWAELCQAATDAIRREDLSAWVLVPGYGGQTPYFWPQNNPTLDVRDPARRLLYAAHVYFDDFSGRYTEPYDSSPGFPRDQLGAYPDLGVERIRPFLDWLEARAAQGIFTEYGVPAGDPRWLDVLDRFLMVLSANPRIVGGTYCEAGLPPGGCGRSGLSVEPDSGQDKPQMIVIRKYPSRS